MSQTYITCKQLLDFIADYLSGDLSAEERRELDRHLAVCPPCVAYLKSYQRTIELEKAAYADPDAPAPGNVPEDLVRAILAAAKKKP